MLRRPVLVAFLALLAVATAVAVAVAAFGNRARYKSTHGARVITFGLRSRLLGMTLVETAVTPKGASSGRPLLVLLHGRSMPTDGLLSDSFFRALRRLGSRAPVVFFPDGGDHSYFHNRKDGPWGSYVLREAIPRAIRVLHANPQRVAIGGVSMGGFGALDLARLAPRRFCAIGAHSAAMWEQASDTAPGAFDGPADFRRNDLFAYAGASRHPYGGTPVWLDVGTHDPFWIVDNAFAQQLRRKGARAQFHVWNGGHDTRYWDAHMATYLAFYAASLAGCSTGSQ